MSDKKTDIFNSGRELFYSKGFKETNVSDIAKMAGIGVGTFYNYYSSKEKLFLEVYIKENEQVKKRIVESLDPNGDPVTVVQKFVTQMVSTMNSNLILKEWYNRDIFSELEQYYHQEERNTECFMQSFCADLIKKWKAEGKIRNDLDDELVLAMFDSLAYIDTHKEEIGIHHFPQIIGYLAEFIMKGLTDYRK